eukprot:15191636-Ditylum_brightwellii.AAC.1
MKLHPSGEEVQRTESLWATVSEGRAGAAFAFPDIGKTSPFHSQVSTWCSAPAGDLDGYLRVLTGLACASL